MSGAFQKRAFQALAFQVGRLLPPRVLTCVARIVPRGIAASVARGPVAILVERGPELAHPLRLSTATTLRLDVELERRGPYLRVSAVERTTP